MPNINDSLCLNKSLDEESLAIIFKNDDYPGGPVAFQELKSVDYIKIFSYVVIIIGGLLGNISVILTVALNRSMRTTINFYVANLAVADAMICIFCMGPHLLGTLTYPSYVLGEFMCKFNPFMQMTCLTSSVLTLSAISCDRFIAIMFPLHVRITKQRTSVVMTVVWIISLLVAVPLLIIKNYLAIEFKNFTQLTCGEKWSRTHYFDEETNRCENYDTYRFLYYVVVTVTLFFLPVAIMITAYSLILWKLWVSEVPGERHAANMLVQYRARKKVITMVFVVLVAFIICWTPLQFVLLISAARKPSSGAYPGWFHHFNWFAYYIAFANSFMNPIIYGGFNKTFREGFCIVLRCGFRRDRFNRPPRSRMTFTTGVASSPSRHTSRTLNGANKSLSQKSSNMEMKSYPINDGEISPNVKETCVSISEAKDITFT